MPIKKQKSAVKRILKNHAFSSRIAFILMGALSTLWFLIRVIPKPSRANYPCMRAAAPVMSGFISYVIGLLATMMAVRKARLHLVNARYAAAVFLIFIAVLTIIFSLTQEEVPVFANSRVLLQPNQPIGEARGIFPGRVVWIRDPDATNENCTNKFGDGWFLPQNTSMEIVSAMAAEMIKKVAGADSVSLAWDALFRYFNQKHDKGDTGYTNNEKIFVKVNHVSASSNTMSDDYTIKNTNRYGMAETSPQFVLAILRQLVNDCGIPEYAISVGDPMKHIYKHVFDMWHEEFPAITYIDYRGAYGRTKPVTDNNPSIFFSDRGTILNDGTQPVISDNLPLAIEEADYMINIAALKGHARAGITLCAKNHFGSVSRSSASHLHNGLVSPNKELTRPGYGLYRVQVDLIAHKFLGANTVLFVVDGLWGGSEANDPPRKFRMTPFDNDWTSSVFASQDQVALESVCFDFLKTEFTADNPYGSYPQYEGADDYLVQAADSLYWPENIKYDPENDGTVTGSLGVHEHWNNAAAKEYSKNLGTGDGIELLFINKTSAPVESAMDPGVRSWILFDNYPNPFNGSTTINYEIPESGFIRLEVYNVLGQKTNILVNEEQMQGYHRVTWSGSDDNKIELNGGIYLYTLTTSSGQETKKMIYVR